MPLTDPTPWLTGDNEDRAVKDLVEYLAGYSGRSFERFAEHTDPHRYEAADVVAVSCLGVEIPAHVSEWLLLGEGQDQTAALLGSPALADPGADLRTHDLADNKAALDLWALLEEHPGMGPTKVSKLLAAKRPHLVPIYDVVVGRTLLPGRPAGDWEWWAPWQDLLRSPTGARLADAAEQVRGNAVAAGADAEHLSVLRVIDVVIWMAERGEPSEG